MKHLIEKLEQAFRRTFFFFPLQLFFVHLKKNITLLLLWILVFGITLGGFGNKYGIPTLFLAPEYLGKVDYHSFFIFGFSVGGFVMAFNLFSYVMNGFRFPFLATLSRPFYKYSINNAFFPTIYIITYLICSARFQYVRELIPSGKVLINLLSFILGYAVFQLIGLSYFIRTNRTAVEKEDDEDVNDQINPMNLQLHKRNKWDLYPERRAWTIVTYLHSITKIRLARDISHYSQETIGRVFRQNRLNASFFQVIAIIVFIVIGLFRENPYFDIPAGASVMLLFTIIVMIFSALNSWLRGWSTFAILLVILLFNFASNHNFLQYENQAYGLNYHVKKAAYTPENIWKLSNDTVQQREDEKTNEEILGKWKGKFNSSKPKIVFLATSGGGLRSALWTYYVLGKADSLLNGKLLKSTFMMTGASGGMIGAAFMRALYFGKINGKVNNYFTDSLTKQIGEDILNPVVFSIVTNDIFIRLQHFNYNGQRYLKDRGFAFEHQLNMNTKGILNKSLGDIKSAVLNAKIPAMIFTPTIVNDGRKLLISDLPISFLANDNPDENVKSNSITDEIDFAQLFGQKQLNNLRLTTAIRMSASFPYILPSVYLPSEPQISVMDAGVRDNYGISTTVHYIFMMRKWLEQNTSGIIILDIRDNTKRSNVEVHPVHSILQKSLSPIGVFYDNIFSMQDFHNDQFVQYMSGWYKGKINVVSFQLDYSHKAPISLSLHLTSRDKQEIFESLTKKNNQQSMKKLIELMKN